MELFHQCASLLISVITKERRDTCRQQRIINRRESSNVKPSKKQWMCFIKNCDELKELMKRKGIWKDGEVGSNEHAAAKEKKKNRKIY